MTDPRPTVEFDKIILRLPDGMRGRLQQLARANGRSANAEAVRALDAWLAHDPDAEPEFLKMPQRLRERVKAAAALNGRSALEEIVARLAESFAPVAPRHVEGEQLDLRTEIRDAMHEAIEGLFADPTRLSRLGYTPPNREGNDEPISE